MLAHSAGEAKGFENSRFEARSALTKSDVRLGQGPSSMRAFGYKLARHLDPSVISPSKGQSSTAVSACRAAERVRELRTGEVHDHTCKDSVLHTEILAPERAAALDLTLIPEAALQRLQASRGARGKEHQTQTPLERLQAVRDGRSEDRSIEIARNVESAGADLTEQDRERARAIERERVLERKRSIEREGQNYSI